MSSSNPRVQRLRRLIGRRSFRYDLRQFVIEGPTLLEEALAAGITVVEQYVREDYDGFFDIEISCLEMDAKTFNSVCDTDSPRGVLALCEMPETVIPQLNSSDWLLVAVEISDPGNLGTLMRSAEAAGASGVVLCGSTVDPFSPKVLRASAGAAFHTPMWQINSLEDLRDMGVRLLGTTSHEEMGESMYESDLSGLMAIVVGNETHGLDPSTPVDGWITIPHVGRAESLNVAMAGTVLAMHVAHTRHTQ